MLFALTVNEFCRLCYIVASLSFNLNLVFQIKLVNINASDVVDGRPAVVMGLIWTIILYFQVKISN